MVGGSRFIKESIQGYVTESGGRFKTWNSLGHMNFMETNLHLGTVLIDYDYASAISDIQELIRSIKRISNRILVLITPEQRNELERLKISGFDGYLIKPVRKASLLNMLEPTPDHDGFAYNSYGRVDDMEKNQIIWDKKFTY